MGQAEERDGMIMILANVVDVAVGPEPPLDKQFVSSG